MIRALRWLAALPGRWIAWERARLAERAQLVAGGYCLSCRKQKHEGETCFDCREGRDSWLG